MIHRIPAPLVRVPVEQRKVGDPQQLPAAFGNQVLLLRDRQPELAEHLRDGVGSARRQDQQVVARGARRLEHATNAVFADRLRRRLHAVGGVARPDQARGAELLRLFDELVDLAPRELRRARNDEPAHGAAVRDRLAEDAERRLGEQRTEVLNLEPEPQVGLVGAVLRDGLRVRHPAERPRDRRRRSRVNAAASAPSTTS